MALIVTSAKAKREHMTSGQTITEAKAYTIWLQFKLQLKPKIIQNFTLNLIFASIWVQFPFQSMQNG